jgi:hypothetical protein
VHAVRHQVEDGRRLPAIRHHLHVQPGGVEQKHVPVRLVPTRFPIQRAGSLRTWSMNSVSALTGRLDARPAPTALSGGADRRKTLLAQRRFAYIRGLAMIAGPTKVQV